MTKFDAIVDYEDDYAQPLIVDALKQRLSSDTYEIVAYEETQSRGTTQPLLEIRQYELLPFEEALQFPATLLISSYCIRQALTRKHNLSNTVWSWSIKHPDTILKQHVKGAVEFELDYAEFLDDALVEAFELRASFDMNEGKPPNEREWWILKPGFSERGDGIRLFSTEEELSAIFEEWEADMPDSDDDEVKSNADEDEGKAHGNVITSHLRHFIAQPYIHPPLLLQSLSSCKFHVRTYVLAVGALKVFVYKPMLALFAAETYAPPWETTERRVHLTNTCLQGSNLREGSVRAFWDLQPVDARPPISTDWKQSAFDQICATTGEVFQAAARGQSIYFQTLPNAFELFGLDFLIDASGRAWLLEVNAGPDFKQTGAELKVLLRGLFEDMVDVAIKPFFNVEGAAVDGTERMVKVLDIDLGRR